MKQSRKRLLPALLILQILAGSSCSKPKVDVYFLPMGRYPAALIDEVVKHCQQRLHLTVSVLPVRPLESKEIDNDRDQAIAEELIEAMKAKYQHLLIDSKAIIIGLTASDIYIREYDWAYAFTLRKGGRCAVVSSARLDPVNFGQRANDDLLRSRLRKIVTKDIGLLHFGLALSEDPHSVLYGHVEGLEELDAMGEEF